MFRLLIFLLPFCAAFFPVNLFGQMAGAAGQSSMSCNISGEIIKVMKSPIFEKGSPCAKYPCRARVKIDKIDACGSSVSLQVNEGDTITFRFAYTLHNTSRLYPRMKIRLPGLKKGDHFTAVAEQRLAVGTQGEFVIYVYKKE